MSLKRPRGWGCGVSLEFWADGKEHLLPGLLAQLQPAWWYNWSPFLGLPDAYPDYIPMIWDGSELAREQTRATLLARPDYVWLLMTEPHSIDQANKSPAEVFAITKQFLLLADETEASGQYASYGVDMTAAGIRWAEEYARLHRQHFHHRAHSYLHWHVYADDANEWNDMWTRFDAWYDVWGANAPVVISEVGARDQDLDKQKRIMDLARWKLMFDDRIVGMAWFSTASSIKYQAASLARFNVATETMELTPLGEYWRSLV